MRQLLWPQKKKLPILKSEPISLMQPWVRGTFLMEVKKSSKDCFRASNVLINYTQHTFRLNPNFPSSSGVMRIKTK